MVFFFFSNQWITNTFSRNFWPSSVSQQHHQNRTNDPLQLVGKKPYPTHTCSHLTAHRPTESPAGRNSKVQFCLWLLVLLLSTSLLQMVLLLLNHHHHQPHRRWRTSSSWSSTPNPSLQTALFFQFSVHQRNAAELAFIASGKSSSPNTCHCRKSCVKNFPFLSKNGFHTLLLLGPRPHERVSVFFTRINSTQKFPTRKGFFSTSSSHCTFYWLENSIITANPIQSKSSRISPFIFCLPFSRICVHTAETK